MKEDFMMTIRKAWENFFFQMVTVMRATLFQTWLVDQENMWAGWMDNMKDTGGRINSPIDSLMNAY